MVGLLLAASLGEPIVLMKNVIKILSLALSGCLLAHPFGETVRRERWLINCLSTPTVSYSLTRTNTHMHYILYLYAQYSKYALF